MRTASSCGLGIVDSDGGSAGSGCALVDEAAAIATGHRSCLGFWAWQMTRPWWISSTWAAYISSGSSSPRNRSWA